MYNSIVDHRYCSTQGIQMETSEHKRYALVINDRNLCDK